jgi:hypothetical protein
VGKPEGKKLLGRTRCRWEDDINMDLKRDGMGWCGVDLIDLTQDRAQWSALVNTVTNFWIP